MVTVTVDGETFSDTYSTKAIEFEVEEKEKPYDFVSNEVDFNISPLKGTKEVEGSLVLNKGDVLTYEISLTASDTSVLFFRN